MIKKYQRRNSIRERISCILSLMLFSAINLASADEGRVCLLPFQSARPFQDEGTQFNEGLKNACGKDLSCINPSAVQNPQYPPRNDRLSPAALKQYIAVAEKNGCGHILFGRILSSGKKRVVIEAKIFSRASKGVTFNHTETLENGADPASAVRCIISRSALVVHNRFPKAGEFAASRGTFDRSIRLKWTGNLSGNRYSIYRAVKRDGPHEMLETTGDTEYSDTTANEGIKYYYRIVPSIDGIMGAGESTWGYIKPKNPLSLSPNGIVEQRIRGKESPATPAIAARVKRDLKLFEEYYESYFMITFIYLVGKMYVNRGELLVYRDFNRYTLDRKNKTIYFHKQDMTVKFLSERFFRFVRDMGWQQIPESEIMPRVVQNGILFCIRMGETESSGSDGITRFIPTYEAVGFSTEYYRDYREWKSNTIVFASSDKELDKKIKEAKSKGY